MSQFNGEHCNPTDNLGSILRLLPMRPVDKVSYAVRRVLNITMTDFARRLGVKRTQMYEVINGNRPSVSLRARIAAALGVAIIDIWPPDLESSSTLAQAGEGVSNFDQGASTHG